MAATWRALNVTIILLSLMLPYRSDAAGVTIIEVDPKYKTTERRI